MAQATRYRDLQAPSALDVSSQSTNGSAAALALSDALKSFSQKSLGFVGEISAQQGATEGEAAGAAKNPKPRTGLAAGTAYGAAYNSAAEAAYSSAVQTDINGTITSIEQGNEANLEGFHVTSKAYADELIAASPVEYRVRVQQALQARITAGDARIRGQQIAKQQNQQHADVIAGMPARAKIALDVAEHGTRDEGDAAIMAAVADNQQQLDALVRDNVMSPLEAQAEQTRFHTMLDKGLIAARTDHITERLMNLARANVESGDNALAQLASNKDLTEDEKNQIRKDYEEQRNNLHFERSRTHADESASLAARLASKEYGASVDGETRRLYNLGALSVDEYQGNLAASARNAQEHLETGIDVTAIRTAMNGGRGLDPTNDKQRKALDKLFTADTAYAGVPTGSPRWQEYAVQIAHRTNMLPESAESWARVNMLSGDPTQAAIGAAFFAKVKDSNRMAWDYQKDPKIVAFAEQTNANLAAGIDPTRSFELAHRNVYEQTEAQKTILNEQYRKEISPKTGTPNSEALQATLDSDDEFDPTIFGRAPSVSDNTPGALAIRSDYDQLVQQFYTSTGGNLDQARSLASDAVRSMYGVSTVNGSPELLKYAPEKMYPGLSADVVRQDIADTLKAADFKGDPKSVRLVPDGNTDRTKGRAWGLITVDEDGNYDTVRDHQNRVVSYALPFGEDYSVAKGKILADKVAEAKKERDKQHKVDDLQEMLDAQDRGMR